MGANAGTGREKRYCHNVCINSKIRDYVLVVQFSCIYRNELKMP